MNRWRVKAYYWIDPFKSIWWTIFVFKTILRLRSNYVPCASLALSQNLNRLIYFAAILKQSCKITRVLLTYFITSQILLTVTLDFEVMYRFFEKATAAVMPPTGQTLAAIFPIAALFSRLYITISCRYQYLYLETKNVFEIKICPCLGVLLYPPASSVCKSIQQQISNLNTDFQIKSGQSVCRPGLPPLSRSRDGALPHRDFEDCIST